MKRQRVVVEGILEVGGSQAEQGRQEIGKSTNV
jgi:hypothetical protein